MSEQVAVNPKTQIAGEIGQLETDLAQLEATRRDQEAKLKSAKGNRTAGAAVLLIGLVVGLFLNLWIGGFLALIGVLTLFTAIGKQSSAQQGLKEFDGQVASLRGKLAEKRAQLAIL